MDLSLEETLNLIKLVNKNQENFINSLNLVEIHDLLEGRRKIEIQLSSPPIPIKKNTPPKKSSKTSRKKRALIGSSIENALQNATSREEGMSILKDQKKKDLKKLANQLDIVLL